MGWSSLFRPRLELLEDRLVPATTFIDTFNVVQAPNPFSISGAPPQSGIKDDIGAVAEIFGGEREVRVDKSTGLNILTAAFSAGESGPGQNDGVGVFSTDGGVSGKMTLIWDGNGGAGDIDGQVDTAGGLGLGGIDFDALFSRIDVSVFTDPTAVGTTMRLTLFDTSGASSSVDNVIPNAATAGFVDLNYNLASFGGINRSAIDAIVLETVNMPAGGDIFIDTICATSVIDLELDKTFGPGSSQIIGENVVYQISVFNDGPNTATGVVVQDILPAGLTFVSASGTNSATYRPDLADNDWNVGTVADNQTITLTITARINGTVTGPIRNYAQVLSHDPAVDNDSVPGDNSGRGQGGDPGEDDDDDDETFTPELVDFGDATVNQTTNAQDGARHRAQGPRLGVNRDLEADATANATATGDDITGSDDEDGVTFPLGINNVAHSALVPVTINSSGNGFINAWFDLNDNGTFELSERVMTNVAVVSGNNNLIIAMPASASVGQQVFARFRLTQADMGATPLPTGLQPTGEVEDYLVTIINPVDLEVNKTVSPPGPNGYQIGDTITYTVSVFNNNAATVGTATNVEVTDVLPSGITFVSAAGVNAGTYNPLGGDNVWNVGILAPGGTAVLTITATISGSGTIRNYAQVTRQDQPDRDSIPDNNSGNPVGPGEDDDDDESITVAQPDFGDAPDSYGTLLASNGARHVISGNTIVLGTNRDGEDNGQPGAAANGDDTNGNPDDEDGVTLPNSGVLVIGQADTIAITGTAGAVVDAWIDFNRDGSFDAVNERISGALGVTIGGGGTANILVTPPNATSVSGTTYARFRVRDAASLVLDPTGIATEGEVEDYSLILIRPSDFGDAPASYGTETTAHEITGLTLGANVDDELPANISANATGDDVNGIDDEDGVIVGTLTQGRNATFTVTVNNANPTSRLNGFIDFNADGDFNDPGEKIINSRNVSTGGVFVISALIPDTAVAGTTFARFRLSDNTGIVNATGVETSGEMEDYQVLINQGLDFGDAPNVYGTNLPGGARHNLGSGLRLGNFVDSEDDGQPSGGADEDDLQPPGGMDDEEGVTIPASLFQGRNAMITGTVSGASANSRLNAWIDFDQNGVFDASEQIATSVNVSGGNFSLTVRVPSFSPVGTTYARFRVSNNTGAVTPDGLETSGEVEDYAVNIALGQDLGDAPDSYGTAVPGAVASHDLGTNLFLGASVDSETDGQPNAAATGDDNNLTPDDEDGITGLTTVTQGALTTITVNVTGNGGLLDAFIDFNRNNAFDAGERITAAGGTAVVNGANNLTFLTPSNAATGASYARFRLSSTGGLNPTGNATDGEVEDYTVTIAQGVDFGDANTNDTRLVDGGARHNLGSNLFLGASVDSETDGTQSVNADADDNNPAGQPDDEDGVTFLTPLVVGRLATVQVVASAAGRLDAFIDYSQSGIFNSPTTERITPLAGLAVNAGVNTFNFIVPSTVASGQTYARFRISTAGGLSNGGLANDGEVEDYRVTILPGTDFGDAPDSYGTLLISDGARHGLSSNLFLGASVDSEDTGIPAASNNPANGDDNDPAAGVDDENGVTIGTLTQGRDVTITGTVSGAGANSRLNAWLDLNDDGDFNDTVGGVSEKIATSVDVSGGNFSITIRVPDVAVVGTTYARFRVSNNTGLVNPTGAEVDGEVEDYEVVINQGIDFGDAPTAAQSGFANSYPVTAGQNGARHNLGSGLRMGTIDSENDGQPNNTATGDDGALSPDDEDGVTLPTGSVLTQNINNTVTINSTGAGFVSLWIDLNANGDWNDAGEQFLNGAAVIGGANNFIINTGLLPTPNINTFMRVRLAANAGEIAAPTGLASTGEVEDHAVLLRQEADLRLTKTVTDNTPFVGDLVDYTVTVTNDGPNPATNVTVSEPLPGGHTFISFTGPGAYDDATGVWTIGTINPGAGNAVSATFRVRIATEATRTNTAQVRTSDQFDPDSTPNNNVPAEDDQASQIITPTAVDFGDAPTVVAGRFPTLVEDNGPRHGNAGPILGASRDTEVNGLPNATATGDDANNTDDENGIVTNPLTIGTTQTIIVNVTNAPAGAFVNGWIDYNQDGDWDDAGEFVLNNVAVVNGLNLPVILIPLDALPGNTFARFRITTAEVVNPVVTGLQPDGEVEDYQILLQRLMDYGDANTTDTLEANNGAAHVAIGLGPFLGNVRPDVDADGQPTAGANGDDNNNPVGEPDDEDGVTFTTPVRQGGTATVSINAPVGGRLDAFIDFNRDGTFDSVTERITPIGSTLLNPGVNNVTFAIPFSASIGPSFARFRVSSDGSLNANGKAFDGEVEDYTVLIEEGFDYGDAQSLNDGYATLLVNDGARHVIGSPLFLGTVTGDIEPTGQPNATATGDDTVGAPDDEDGVTFTSGLIQGRDATVTVVASQTGRLDAFIDFNRDGDFADAGEKIFDNVAVNAGANNLTYRVASTAGVGGTAARFRLSTVGGLSFNGSAADGEVEDYMVTVAPGTDFGDAPNTYGTLTANNGASHLLGGALFLGANVDSEADGQPATAPNPANGDDNNQGPDDENGVTIAATITQGTTVNVTVNASATGRLDAFIDFNRDGDFDAGEKIFDNVALAAGANNLSFFAPINATVGATYGRFRVSTVGGLGATGQAADGEVEDYELTIAQGVDFGDADMGDTLLADNGARHNLGSTLFLGNLVDAEADTTRSVNADNDDTNNLDDEDGIAFLTPLVVGRQATIQVVSSATGRLDAFIDYSQGGLFNGANERITPVGGLVVNAGVNTFTFVVPSNVASGQTYARFRLSSAGGLNGDGLANDGEVEDYFITLAPGTDFGDAPASYGTLLANDGARHGLSSNLFLGAGVDSENDGLPALAGAPATGDDADPVGGVDDENGVVLSPVIIGLTSNVTVNASQGGRLDGFVDFNRDGDFTDPGEKVFDNVAVNAGNNALTFNTPLTAVAGVSYARFRISTAGGLGATGAAVDGEVEDYSINIINGGSVSGTVFIDNNDDGLLNNGDGRLGGVEINVVDANGVVVGTTLSNLDGTYSVIGLPPGTYTIVQTQPNGYNSSTPNTIGNVVVVANQDTPNNNFGETTGSLGGLVYHDANNNGIREANEAVLSGVVVTLTGTDANGLPVNRVTSTGANGTYLFDNLLAGTYTVTETQPAGFNDGIDSVGNSGGTLAPPDAITTINLVAGFDAVNYNFGETGTVLSGVVFRDDNNNGTREATEVGIGGVLLTLIDNTTGSGVGTTLTAPDGTYAFENLVPNRSYMVVEAQPAGYTSTTPDVIANAVVPVTGLPNQNFGERTTNASLAGSVYVDLNNNGVRDGNEPGIAGVTVNLTGPVNRTATTADDGSYSFIDLPPGTYTVTEVQPTGFTDGTDRVGTPAGGTLGNDVISNIVLGTSVNAVNYDFGERGTTLSGSVYIDANVSQVREPGETGIGNVTITLRDANGNVVATTTTSAVDGSYSFNNLAPGDYTITETQPAGFGSTTPNVLNVSLPPTGLTNQNFGENNASSISGVVYVDANNNGVQDPSEPGIAGATVNLTGPVNQTVTTAADGSYSFTNLPAGIYTVTETQPVGFNDGIDAPGTSGGTLAPPDAINNINLGTNVQATGYNFGELAPNPSISGTVFVDADGNGTRDPNEPGLGGVLLTLRDVNGVVVGTATTAADGSYVFINVPPGNYSITETQPNGFGSSTPNVLNVVQPAGGLANQNFGETTGSISGRVFADNDGNATINGPDAGIPGVQVRLTGTDVNGQAVNLVTATDANGNYTFTGLVAGTYVVTESQPDRFVDHLETVGSTGGTLAPPDTINNITLDPAENATDYLFAEIPIADPLGFVFIDLDNDGIREPGEPGVANVPIRMTGTDILGNVVDVTVNTDANGLYQFAERAPGLPLLPGVYTITELSGPPRSATLPPALANLLDGQEENGLPPAAVVVNDQFQNIDLRVAPFFGEAYNFGELQPASISGSSYLDSNNNGIREATERGIPGTLIRLTGVDDRGLNIDVTVTTDALGNFSFRRMRPGTYTLTSTHPASFVDGIDSVGVGVANPGVAGNDVINGIVLTAGQNGTNFRFGERSLLPSLISKRLLLSIYGILPGTPGPGVVNVKPIGNADPAGFVYLDLNDNGIKEAGEPGIAGVQITLTGTSVTGQQVHQWMLTDNNGYYQFDELEAGVYTVIQTQPTGYADGKDTLGNLGGVLQNDRFSNIVLGPTDIGAGYNFGERPATGDNPAAGSVAPTGVPTTVAEFPTYAGPTVADVAYGITIADLITSARSPRAMVSSVTPITTPDSADAVALDSDSRGATTEEVTRRHRIAGGVMVRDAIFSEDHGWNSGAIAGDVELIEMFQGAGDAEEATDDSNLRDSLFAGESWEHEIPVSDEVTDLLARYLLKV